MSRPRYFRKSFAQEFGKSLARAIVVTGLALVVMLFDLAIHHLE